MSFASFEFLVFFPIVTALFFLFPHRLRWALLLCASTGFYMYFVPRYILILGFTIIVDYAAGIFIEGAEGQRRRAFLLLSLTANLGVLGFFKYAGFFTENLDALTAFAFGRRWLPEVHVLLPIGLSFHTFQAMSYTIEVYRGNQRAERHFGIYALYVMFYPQLVAGPIERPQNVLHQFHEEQFFDYARVTSGLRLMLWGAFKKIVIADRLGILVDAVYKNPRGASGLEIAIALIAFLFQIYGDFSGYSDIALGSARVMGFTLMKNFDSPLRSSSVTEFWRRWHISLSSWFNDYLFQPLAIALRDRGRLGLGIALFTTFVLSGLWHGAGWTFLLYGAVHGGAVVYEALTKKTRKKLSAAVGARPYEAVTWLFTFGFVTLALVFFRSADVAEAGYVFGRVLSPWTAGWFHLGGEALAVIPPWKQALSFAPLVVLLVIERDGDAVMKWFDAAARPLRFAAYYALIGSILVFGAFDSKQFIYFQF